MQTIAIVNEKGGTGKTTTSVNLSAALGQLGKKVLLVDLDGQAASSRWLGVEEDTSFADALWRGEDFRPIPEVVPGVWLAPGSGKLDSVAHDLRPTQGGQLRRLLGQVAGFDYVLIDCPPSLGNRLIGNALLAASHAIVPVETSILALDGLKILLTTFQDIRDGFGHDVILAGVLACRYDARTRLSPLVVAELKRALPGKVFQTVIRENVRVRECPASGKSILEYAPDCHAAEDYLALAREVVGLPWAGLLAASPDRGCARDAAELAACGLTEEERQAVIEMRQKVDELVRQTVVRGGAGAAARSDPAADPAGAFRPAAGGLDADPAETFPPARAAGLDVDPVVRYGRLEDVRAIQFDSPEDFEPSGDEDAPVWETDVHDRPVGLAEEREERDPLGMDLSDEDPSAEEPLAELEVERFADEPPAEEAPAERFVEAPAEDPPAEGLSPAPWTDGPAAERESPEAGGAAETWPAAPGEAASPADPPADRLEQYPALQAMLREMAGRADPTPAK